MGSEMCIRDSFQSLEEVLDFYSNGVQHSFNLDAKMEFAHQRGLNLSEADKENIVHFLHTLTDSIFLYNPAFGNPF